MFSAKLDLKILPLVGLAQGCTNDRQDLQMWSVVSLRQKNTYKPAPTDREPRYSQLHRTFDKIQYTESLPFCQCCDSPNSCFCWLHTLNYEHSLKKLMGPCGWWKQLNGHTEVKPCNHVKKLQCENCIRIRPLFARILEIFDQVIKKGTKMAKFERVNFLRASLSPEEVHLYSFKGLLCAWDQGRISSKETPILIEDISLLGHVTNARLIIEPRKMKSLSMILGELSPKFLERIVPGMDLPYGVFTTEWGGKDMMNHVADQIGHLSFDFADMDHLGVYKDSACWPVMKYHMNGRDPAFLPFTLFRVTAYTGAIVGSPAPDEFAEVIRNLGVRIVTYTSKAS